MMDNDLILKLYNCQETVFTMDEIAQLMPGISIESLLDRLYYFTKIGKLKRLRQGIYAKVEYDVLELANKVYRPSYISLETVLCRSGVIFQYYERIFVASYVTRSVVVEGKEIQYRKIKNDILVNTTGLEWKTGYFIATAERAFLDTIYVYKNYYFDNLRGIDWDKVSTLKKIYNSKVLDKRVDEYYKIAHKNND